METHPALELGLARDPKLRGRITLELLIPRDGTVSNVADAGNELPDPEVLPCVIQVFQGMRFPAPSGGIAIVHYPLVLQPE